MRKKTQISESKVQMTKSKARKNAKGQKYEKGSKSWKHKTEAFVVFFLQRSWEKITKQSSKEPRIGEKKKHKQKEVQYLGGRRAMIRITRFTNTKASSLGLLSTDRQSFFQKNKEVKLPWSCFYESKEVGSWWVLRFKAICTDGLTKLIRMRD